MFLIWTEISIDGQNFIWDSQFLVALHIQLDQNILLHIHIPFSLSGEKFQWQPLLGFDFLWKRALEIYAISLIFAVLFTNMQVENITEDKHTLLQGRMSPTYSINLGSLT